MKDHVSFRLCKKRLTVSPFGATIKRKWSIGKRVLSFYKIGRVK